MAKAVDITEFGADDIACGDQTQIVNESNWGIANETIEFQPTPFPDGIAAEPPSRARIVVTIPKIEQPRLMILKLSREAERLAVAIDPVDQRTSPRALRSKSVLFCYTCNCEVIEEKSRRSSFFGREPLDTPSLVNCFRLSSYRAISSAAPLSFLLCKFRHQRWLADL